MDKIKMILVLQYTTNGYKVYLEEYKDNTLLFKDLLTKDSIKLGEYAAKSIYDNYCNNISNKLFVLTLNYTQRSPFLYCKRTYEFIDSSDWSFI